MAESEEHCPSCAAALDLEGLPLYEAETKQSIICPGALREDVTGCGVTLQRFRHHGEWAPWRAIQSAAAKGRSA